MNGKIKKLVEDKGFGFITPDSSSADVFFHISSLKGIDFKELYEDQRVAFETQQSDKGPRAINVRPI